jgi:hypothetical protein
VAAASIVLVAVRRLANESLAAESRDVESRGVESLDKDILQEGKLFLLWPDGNLIASYVRARRVRLPDMGVRVVQAS